MRRSDKCYLALGLLLLASELYKQYLLTFRIGGGSYDWWYFPFQLCSLPLYLLPAYALLRSQRAKEVILTFLATYNLVGGTLVFFDISGMFYPLTVLTVHSFLWHFAVIGIGLYSGYLLQARPKNPPHPAAAEVHPACKLSLVYDHQPAPAATEANPAAPVSPAQKATLSGILLEEKPNPTPRLSPVQKAVLSGAKKRAAGKKRFVCSTLLYLCFCGIAELINLLAAPYGVINLFYISPLQPMEQVLFREIAAVLGNGAGILSYIAGTILISYLLFLLWQSAPEPRGASPRPGDADSN